MLSSGQDFLIVMILFSFALESCTRLKFVEIFPPREPVCSLTDFCYYPVYHTLDIREETEANNLMMNINNELFYS